MVTHKLKNKNGAFAFSECGRALHIVGGDAVDDWDNVTCKNCLKHLGDASVSKEVKENE